MGCLQSNWHLLLLLLGILAMGTTSTTPIQLPKMQLIYGSTGLDLQLEYS
jgi:hypothetical protein